MLTVITGDAIEQLRTLPDESVQCCVTSPPYWGLRDYGTAAWEGGDYGCDHTRDRSAGVLSSTLDGGKSTVNHQREASYGSICGKCGAARIDAQQGLEKTPAEYVAKLVEVFREVRRVLRRDGALWLNLGDSYARTGGWSDNHGLSDLPRGECGRAKTFNNKTPFTLKEKDLCGIPWRVAFALQADGWWLRSDIIWAKPNPMPESVTDRPTKAHEYLFLLTKSANYFYDAEAIKERAIEGLDLGIPSGNRNKRSVWTVATAPYPEAHFATYPPDLIKPCIMAGTSAKGCCAKCGAPSERITGRDCEPKYVAPSSLDRFGNGDAGVHRNIGGQYSKWMDENPMKTLGWQPTCKCDAGVVPCAVLDPFAGSGTTGMVALELGRRAVLIELNPKYCELIRQRCDVTPGLQLA